MNEKGIDSFGKSEKKGKFRYPLPTVYEGALTVQWTVDKIRAEKGNLRYEYYISLDDPETVLLIDSWADQAAIDVHHASPMMATIATLRQKYDLHMTVERYVSIDDN